MTNIPYGESLKYNTSTGINQEYLSRTVQKSSFVLQDVPVPPALAPDILEGEYYTKHVHELRPTRETRTFGDLGWHL
jgi:hypothetical protein